MNHNAFLKDILFYIYGSLADRNKENTGAVVPAKRGYLLSNTVST